jgi:hypothetical protein
MVGTALFQGRALVGASGERRGTQEGNGNGGGPVYSHETPSEVVMSPNLSSRPFTNGS